MFFRKLGNHSLGLLLIGSLYLSCEQGNAYQFQDLSEADISGANEFTIQEKSYNTRDNDTWDTIVTPVNGDNQAHLRNIFTDEKNQRILIKKGTYPIDVAIDDKTKGPNKDERDNLLIKNRTDVMIVFEEGAKLIVTPNSYGHRGAEYSVITIDNSKNITIINPVIEGDKHTHTQDKGGEWAAGIQVTRNSENIHIDGADVQKMWGDGITISQGQAKESVFPRNILIENYKTIDNGRNGMSITGGKGITVRNGETAKNNRTAPKAGIDIERGGSYTPLENIIIDNVKFWDNPHGLISFSGTGTALFNNLDVENGFRIRSNRGLHIVRNSTFRRGDTNPGTRVDFYTPNSPIQFYNNEVKDIRLLIQGAKEEIIINKNEFTGGKYEKNGFIVTGMVAKDERYNTGRITIENNIFSQKSSDSRLSAGIILNSTEDYVNLFNNKFDMGNARYGIHIKSKARKIIASQNEIKLSNKHDAKVKIIGEKGAIYDFSQNIPDFSKHSTKNLNSSIDIEVK